MACTEPAKLLLGVTTNTWSYPLPTHSECRDRVCCSAQRATSSMTGVSSDLEISAGCLPRCHPGGPAGQPSHRSHPPLEACSDEGAICSTSLWVQPAGLVLGDAGLHVRAHMEGAPGITAFMALTSSSTSCPACECLWPVEASRA